MARTKCGVVGSMVQGPGVCAGRGVAGISVMVFIGLDLLKDVSLCLSQTLAWRAAVEHPMAAVAFNIVNGGKVYRRVAVAAPAHQSEFVACFF